MGRVIEQLSRFRCAVHIVLIDYFSLLFSRTVYRYFRAYPFFYFLVFHFIPLFSFWFRAAD